jgi:hypothetical protein
VSTSLHVLPTPPSQALEAAECDVRIRKAVGAYNRSFGSLAYWAWRLKRINGYEAIGYQSEAEYFVSLNVSRAWYYHAVAIGQACAHMSEEELGDIPVGVAELMLSVRPEIRTMYRWAEEAKLLSYGQFARNVEERNDQIPGVSKKAQAVLSIRVPAVAKEAVLERMEEYKVRHSLSSPGQALELMVAERWESKNALASLAEVRELLASVARSMKPVPRRMKMKEKLYRARTRLDEAYEELVRLNREGSGDAVCGKTVCPAEASEGNQNNLGRQDGYPEQRGGTCSEGQGQERVVSPAEW